MDKKEQNDSNPRRIRKLVLFRAAGALHSRLVFEECGMKSANDDRYNKRQPINWPSEIAGFCLGVIMVSAMLILVVGGWRG